MSKMNFDQFTKEVVAKVREYLPETFKDASLELTHVIKNNDMEFTGLVIKTADNCVFPTIYLDRFFEDYQSGEDMGRVIRKIADIRINNDIKNPFDVDMIMDFKNIKEMVVPRLIGKDWNKTLLESLPHKSIADLAVTYHVVLSNKKGRIASTAITNALMETWGVTVEEIHDLSIQNMHVIAPSAFRGISTVLSGIYFGKEIEIDPSDEIMFVLSNDKSTYGAAAILDDRIMGKVVDRFGTAFYVLPSSVHEVLIVPETPDVQLGQLRDMVRSINASSVSPEDRLSDSVYRYTLRDGLKLA